MAREFSYNFDPASQNPAPPGSTVTLDVIDIEDAGTREVLQTSGPTRDSWFALDQLLLPAMTANNMFIFKEPLGQSREVKTALSGLFGRFVARAYLERYFGLSIFASPSDFPMHLNNGKLANVRRRSNGDLPDWVACKSNQTSFTVAEAKGSYAPGGPRKALKKAWKQANRINVTINGRNASVKRIAIATRWGVYNTAIPDPMLWVKDPDDEGDLIDQQDEEAIFISLLRLHISSMISRLGHAKLASELRILTRIISKNEINAHTEYARHLLEETPKPEVRAEGNFSRLIGGVVTRLGAIDRDTVSKTLQEILARLDLHPMFVGIDRDLIDTAIDGQIENIRGRIAETSRLNDIPGRTDRAGGLSSPST